MQPRAEVVRAGRGLVGAHLSVEPDGGGSVLRHEMAVPVALSEQIARRGNPGFRQPVAGRVQSQFEKENGCGEAAYR